MGVGAPHDVRAGLVLGLLARGEADGHPGRQAEGAGQRGVGAGELLAVAGSAAERVQEDGEGLGAVAGTDVEAVPEVGAEPVLQREGLSVGVGRPAHGFRREATGDRPGGLGQSGEAGQELGVQPGGADREVNGIEAGQDRQHVVLETIGGLPARGDDQRGRVTVPVHVGIRAVDRDGLEGGGEPDLVEGADPEVLAEPGRPGSRVGGRRQAAVDPDVVARRRPDLAVEGVERGDPPIGRGRGVDPEGLDRRLLDQAGPDVDQGAEGHPVVVAPTAVEVDERVGRHRPAVEARRSPPG